MDRVDLLVIYNEWLPAFDKITKLLRSSPSHEFRLNDFAILGQIYKMCALDSQFDPYGDNQEKAKDESSKSEIKKEPEQ